MIKYKVIRNLTTCNCHPETCCHFAYFVIGSDKKVVFKTDSLRSAEFKCEKLNND